MEGYSFSELIAFFTLYSMMGWFCESLWASARARRFVNSGFLGGPWCPVYGFGAVILLLLAVPLRRYLPLVFLLAFITALLLEYFTGWLLEALFKTRWWDYSGRRLQFRGRVCLANTLLFGLMGLGAIYLTQPFLEGVLNRVPMHILRVAASAIVAALFFDLVHSLAAAASLEERLGQASRALGELEEHLDAGWRAEEGSKGLRRLHELGAAQPGNKALQALVQTIEGFVAREGGGCRLLRSFPTMKPHQGREALALVRGQLAGTCPGGPAHRLPLKAALQQQHTLFRNRLRQAYQGVTLTRMVWVFFMGSVIGYVAETLFCLVTRGYIESRQGMVYGPFSQIYGFGAVFMVLLLAPLAHKGAGWLFVGSAAVGSVFEALCSLAQENLFHSQSWQYSAYPLSFFGGRANLMFACFWGVMGMVYMKLIYPPMARLVDRIPKRPKLFFTWVIAVFLLADMLLSALAVGRWSERLVRKPAESIVAQWLDKHYPNKMLEEIYPNMGFLNTVNGNAEK